MINHHRSLVPAAAAALLTTCAFGQLAPATQPDTMPDLSEILDALEEIRGIEFKHEVPAEKQSMDDFKAYIEGQIEKYFPEEKQEAMQLGLRRLGLLDEPIDMGEELTNAMLSQAAAYYDPESSKFYYLMTDMPLMALQTVAAHELVHALQDQHYDLGTMMEALEAGADAGPRNDDRMLAFRYLVEGEATYVMTLWQVKSMMGMDLTANPQMEAAQLQMMADMDIAQLIAMTQAQMPAGGDGGAMADAIKAMKDIPPYILHPLYAAYMQGAYFAMSIRHAEGWEGVGKAFESLPQSSEQTMHPEKFLDERDDPTSMPVAPLAAAKAAGLEEIDSAILGEYYLRLLLRNFEVEREQARGAAAGWDGDLYRAFRDESGGVSIVLATTWDDEDHATEFVDAYRAALARKYPKLTASHEQDDETGSAFHFNCGEAGLGVGRLVRHGREVFIIEGTTTNAADRILDELKGWDVEYVE